MVIRDCIRTQRMWYKVSDFNGATQITVFHLHLAVYLKDFYVSVALKRSVGLKQHCLSVLCDNVFLAGEDTMCALKIERPYHCYLRLLLVPAV
jgi:hypothetical protein